MILKIFVLVLLSLGRMDKKGESLSVANLLCVKHRIVEFFNIILVNATVSPKRSCSNFIREETEAQRDLAIVLQVLLGKNGV